MNTTSLELSRQLQAQFPDWRHDNSNFWWEVTSNGTHLSKEWHSLTFHPHIKDNFVARDLDELRVLALELIKEIVVDVVRADNLLDELKDVLIEGCDHTAEWIIETFGASNA